MIVYSDNIEFAKRVLPDATGWNDSKPSNSDLDLTHLISRIYRDRQYYRTVVYNSDFWKYLFIVEKAQSSQYDLLVELMQENFELPDGFLCLAGSGSNFHGQRNRSWQAPEGNLHLTVHVAPGKKISHYGVAFTVLSAVAGVDALRTYDEIKDRVGIKWVNDIMLDDAKIGGVLTHTQSIDGVITSAILGIGLNVETRPEIAADRFVPEIVSLNECLTNPGSGRLAEVTDKLIKTLEINYRHLLDNNYPVLLRKYRNYSIIKGRLVEIFSDPIAGTEEKMAAGKVTDIGDNLEIHLDNRTEPITKGRLVIKT